MCAAPGANTIRWPTTVRRAGSTRSTTVIAAMSAHCDAKPPPAAAWKLLVATGGNHKDVVRPIGAPECHHLVDRGVDARRDARQQAVGGRATKAEQPHRAVVGDPQRDKPIGWRDHLCRCCRSIAHRITRQGRRANQLRNKQTGQQDPRAKPPRDEPVSNGGRRRSAPTSPSAPPAPEHRRWRNEP